MLATVLLLGLVLVATVTDFLRQKIYNWTTYSGMLAALGLNTLGAILAETGWAEQRQLDKLGCIGPAQSLFGLLACGLVMLLCFVTFKIGGGDVKLIAMLGAFLGPEKGIEAMLWTFVFGGCTGLIVLIWRVGPARIVVWAVKQIGYSLRLRGWSPLTDEQREQLKPRLALAPNALAAVVVVQFWSTFLQF